MVARRPQRTVRRQYVELLGDVQLLQQIDDALKQTVRHQPVGVVGHDLCHFRRRVRAPRHAGTRFEQLLQAGHERLAPVVVQQHRDQPARQSRMVDGLLLRGAQQLQRHILVHVEHVRQDDALVDQLFGQDGVTELGQRDALGDALFDRFPAFPVLGRVFQQREKVLLVLAEQRFQRDGVRRVGLFHSEQCAQRPTA
uniref:Uncharacterized protein n=1 Tax=Anopheles coluzzii TaxID=1518534 RepID=A0A8W7PEJ1_ANOCL